MPANLVAGLEDGRLDSQHMSGLYGHRSNSSASSSPPAQVGQSGQSGDGGLVVPQPVNAKHHGHHTNGGSSGRKYQCKMCPQVGKVKPLQLCLVCTGRCGLMYSALGSGDRVNGLKSRS